MSNNDALKNLKVLSPEIFKEVKTKLETLRLTKKESGINIADCIRDVFEYQYHIQIVIVTNKKNNYKYHIVYGKKKENYDLEFKNYGKALESALSNALDRLLFEKNLTNKDFKACFQA